MDQKGLIRAVAGRTGLSRGESADISRAVLEGLADQLSGGEARRLAADLPDLAGQLQARRRRRPEAHPVKLQDFIKQVSERTAMTDEDTGLEPEPFSPCSARRCARRSTAISPASSPRSTPRWRRQPTDRAAVPGRASASPGIGAGMQYPH